MELSVKPGKYVVAVSGGVDSIVLLDLLAKQKDLDLIIAHFDHGIRSESNEDRMFVQNLAKHYSLTFEYKREELGPNANEAWARERRYRFLNEVKVSHSADAVITAHHKDDVLETACINLIRGTSRKGLASLVSGKVLRPLLAYTKTEILSYAKNNNLSWREDATNSDQKYLRNFVRAKLALADKLTEEKLLKIIYENKERNTEIDNLLEETYNYGYDKIGNYFSRSFFISLPYAVSCELMAHWLRKKFVEFDRKNIELLVVALKTGQSSTRLDAGRGLVFEIGRKQIGLREVSSV